VRYWPGIGNVAVFTYRAAAHRHQDLLVISPEPGAGGVNLCFQFRREGFGTDQLQRLGAEAVQQVKFIDINQVFLFDNLFFEVVVLKEEVKTFGGDGKSLGHRDIEAVFDLPQIGVLAAGPVAVLEVDLVIGHDRVRGMIHFALIDDGLDLFVDPLQRVVELAVSAAGHDIEAFDHLKGRV
jgi:hypothetical protein